MRTRVGYAGGSTPSPTYQTIGDHSEALQVDFDPAVLSYRDLLEEFFATHNPCARAYSRQYRSAIFVHDAAQRRAAEELAARVAGERGRPVTTALEDVKGFTLAEDDHQKYRLRSEPAVLAELQALYPGRAEFLTSTAVTRANAFLAGDAPEQRVRADLPRMGLSAAARARVEQYALR